MIDNTYNLSYDCKYLETTEVPKVEPHCNCEGCYEFNGKKITWLVGSMGANLQLTKQSEDLCDFCGCYVHWQEVSKVGKYDRSKISKK